MSDSVQPHRRQPTRPPCPWDSPGKNTGVGFHFLLQRMKVKSESEVTQSCPTLCDPMDCSLPGSSIHGIFQARVLEWVAISFSTRQPSSFLSVKRINPDLTVNDSSRMSGLVVSLVKILLFNLCGILLLLLFQFGFGFGRPLCLQDLSSTTRV